MIAFLCRRKTGFSDYMKSRKHSTKDGAMDSILKRLFR